MDWDIIHGNCLEVMRSMADASVDAVVTDPPYGLRFMGKDWDHGIPGPAFWREALRVSKPGAHLLAFGGTRTSHRLVSAIEDAGWEIRDSLCWLYGQGFPKSHNGPWGGTALKPAHEPICLARKPLVGTVAANVAAHGTGGLNVDGCRIGTSDDLNGGTYSGEKRRSDEYSSTDSAPGARPLSRLNNGLGEYRQPTGRWPANVVLDEDAAARLDAQSGERKSGGGERHGLNRIGLRGNNALSPSSYDRGSDTGGASRFFYTSKASRAEREAGLEGMPQREKANQYGDGLNSATKVRTDEQGVDRGGARNTHPTVKPIALMRWLCRLITPPNGLILDPFAGSGSTGCAAALEGFRFVGIEQEAEYCEIARRRIAHWESTMQPDLEPAA